MEKRPLLDFASGIAPQSEETLVVRPIRNPEVVLQLRDAFTVFGNFVLIPGTMFLRLLKRFFSDHRGFAVSMEGMTFYEVIRKYLKETI